MNIKKILISIAVPCSILMVQAQQISIPRIDQMPDKPVNYKMLDWKQLSRDYNQFVFDVSKSGNYLPLTKIRASDGINYPDIKNIGMSTFVGHTDVNAAEAINIIPSIVGASLVGVDKTNDQGVNWVEKVKDFFNRKNGQNVYLNNYSASTGGDWWYELMPNVFFMQLQSLYPEADADFKDQIVTLADRQLDVLFKLGGKLYPWTNPNMNYRAFDLLQGTPNSNGVLQPEAAGSIAWILHQAYLTTSDVRYKEGAELALSFLQTWTSNPAYEIQLPYGVVTAARLNAEEGTNYDINKFLNWTFSSGKGTLRGWGTIVGSWNGYDMSGLIGEANDGGNDYAFSMNGFQHAAALAPVAKYDKRYAAALAKWILNLANASRYFYPEQMNADNQENISLQWSKTNVPTACIPYESIKQTWEGKSPYAMGDALKGGWAATNLSLYSGSSVGYLASLISTTNVEGILQIDLNVTDFNGENSYPNFLYYNPNGNSESVRIDLPVGSFDIYDAISETVIKSGVSGSANFTIDSKDVRLLVVYPSGSTTNQVSNLLKITNGGVIDYHSGYKYDNSFRIKSFSADKKQVNAGEAAVFNCLTENASGTVNYKWFVNGTEVANENKSPYTWKPAQGGIFTLKAISSNNGKDLETHEIKIVAIGGEYVYPEIQDITISGSEPHALGSVVDVTATTNAPAATIEWSVSGGTLKNTEGLTPQWTLPAEAGTYTITLTIKNILGEKSLSRNVLVKDLDEMTEDYTPLVYYSFNGNTKNGVQDNLHSVLSGAVPANDARNMPDAAYRFENGLQYIYTVNDPALNFRDEMTLSFWMKPESLGTEQYVISHGSWEQRYKLSLTPEGKLIMTLNTSGGIIDMADETPLVENQFYHYTIVYNGASLEMYRNGQLINSRAHTGQIGISSNNLTFARKDDKTTDYTFIGILDEFRLYDVAVDPTYVAKLPEMWGMEGAGDVSISRLTVNGVEWSIAEKYVIPCGDNVTSIPITIEPVAGATVDLGSNVVIEFDKPAVKSLKFTITSADGTESQNYTLLLEKRFAYNDLISQKWNNTLTINNNAATNGGFTFTGYKWFKNGEAVGNKQYYSAGSKATDYLDETASYMAEVITDSNELLRTCEGSPIITQSEKFILYPNPAKTGETITVDSGLENEVLKNAYLSVYATSGVCVLQQKVDSRVTTFSVNQSGTYVLYLKVNDDVNYSSTFIVY